MGGTWDGPSRYFAPTVVADVTWDDPLMQEEIFGPVLPIVSYDDIDEALGEVNRRDKPLALYIYSDDDGLIEKVIAATSSGSVCTNHNAVQLGVPGLPFGGVGASGLGAYHGKAGFDTFSHTKAVFRRPSAVRCRWSTRPTTASSGGCCGGRCRRGGNSAPGGA